MSKLTLSSNASGSGNVTLQSPNTDSDFTVTVPSGTGAMPLMKLETAVTASGTSVDFTSIPSWVKRITVMFSGVSTSGTSAMLIQLGDSGGIETTGYQSQAGSRTSETTSASGLVVNNVSVAASLYSGNVYLNNQDGNNWVSSGVVTASTSAPAMSAGAKTLSDTLTQVRITAVNGTDTFDAGTINILYEG